MNLYNDLLKKKIVDDNGIVRGYRNPRNIRVNHPDIYARILEETAFLDAEAKMAERIYCIKHNLTSAPLCKECGKKVNFKDGRYFKFCSSKCSNNSKETKVKKENACIEKFGTKYASQNQDIKEKQKKAFQKRYGVDYPFQNKSVMNSMKETWIQKYGVDNPRKSKEIIQRIKNTKKERYGVESTAQLHISPDSLEKLNSYDWLYNEHVVKEIPLQVIGKNLNVSDVTVGNYLRKHNIETMYYTSSEGEKEICAFLENNDIKVTRNTRVLIHPLEIDIYLPDYNIAIEYCGLFWHSEQMGKNKNYHKEKLNRCKEMNITLFTIFEDEWKNKRDIIKRKLLYHTGKITERVYARNTVIKKISAEEKKIFLDSFHIQGNGRGSINYGLFHNDELVASMTFVKQGEEFILNRYASSCHVIGGFSKLLKYFKNHNVWKRIITFADLRWSDGNLYEKTGWTLDYILPPDYNYIKSGERYHKFNFRKKSIAKMVSNYDESLSESENLEKNNVLKIWNCGLKRYIIQ